MIDNEEGVSRVGGGTRLALSIDESEPKYKMPHRIDTFERAGRDAHIGFFESGFDARWDVAGREATAEIVGDTRRMFVQTIGLPEGEQPDHFSKYQMRSLLRWLE
jgi:hypothetical protein